MKKYLLLILLIFLIQCGEKSKTAIEKKVLPSELFVIAKNGLVLRDQPYQNGKSIILIPFNTKVSIIEASEQKVQINNITAPWYKVKWDTKEGWAFSGFLKPIVTYPDQILSFPVLNISSYIPENIFKSTGISKIKIEDLNSVPDILIDTELIVVDNNEVYYDSIGDIYIEPESETNDVYFKLKSGKKFKDNKTPIFFRKSYYKSLSESLPILFKIQNITDNNLSEQLYKAIGKNDSIWLVHSTSENKDKESIARKNFNLTIYDISGNGNKTYLSTLQNKDKETWFYNTFIFMTNGKIVFTENGNYLNSFKINSDLYVVFDTWYPESEGRV